MTLQSRTSQAAAENAMAALQGGFDAAMPPQDRRMQALWHVGEWLRAQGAERPTTLVRAEDGLIVVNGQILTIDADGQIQNLSALRRRGVRPPDDQGQNA